MDFTFSAEQQELRAAVRELAAGRATSADVRRAMESETGVDADLWRTAATEMGLVGIGVGEDLGGAGGDFVDAAVVLEECGRALLPVPLLSTVVAAQALAASGAAAADALARVVAGETPGAVGVASAPLSTGRIGFGGGASAGGGALTGRVDHILDGAAAGVLLVADPDGLWLVHAGGAGLAVRPRQTLDPTRKQATVELERANAVSLGSGEHAARVVDLLRVALAVEAVGVARRCLEMTVDYLNTREQFGRVIGSFQALQHRCADLAVEVEAAASTAYYAAWAVAAAPEEVPVVAPLALAVCADAAWHVAAETIQLHGGIGFTWEHDAHLYFKRATTTRLLLGDAHEQRRLVAARAGLRG
jgi:alkylation response protein AidB-like acyl-CoA dehydrogenase